MTMPSKLQNCYPKARLLGFFVLLFEATQSLYAQTIPSALNQRNTEGNRIGEWVITYTKNWKETSIADSIVFYRKITFDKAGKPQGKTRDYYRSGALQFEGVMLQIEPEEITDGLCIFYHENGQKSKEATFVNGKEEGFVKTWYDNGRPQYRYENKNGGIDGIVTGWNEKGDSTKLYFENGKRIDWQTINENVSKLYQQGKYAEATEKAEKCLTLIRLTLGESNKYYAWGLNNLAGLYKSQGQYSKAEPYFLQALAISKKALGEEHPNYATSLNNLAGLYRYQKKYDTAEPFLLQSILFEKNNLLTFLETADQAQQEAYIRTREHVFELGHSFGLLAKTPKSATSAYEASLLTKGLQLKNTTQLLNYIRQTKDTLLQAQHERWLGLKRSINTQNNQPIAKRVGVTVMQEQADSLYKIMARHSVAFRNFKAAFQITPQAIQKQLKTHEAAIEFVHFQYHNGKRWTDSTYYAALILRKGWAAPRMVYLCEQRALDSLLSLKGNEQRNSQYVERIYGYGNRGIGTSKEKPLRSLYTLLWQPIDSLLIGVSTVYYSPSGLLNRINIAAIATPTPRQRLMDKYTQLVQLRSTCEIVLSKEPTTYTQQALLMGGIEYNLDSLAYHRVNAGYQQNRGNVFLSLPNNRGGIYSPLPATNAEISTIQTLIQAQQWRADTLKDLRASEEAFQFYTTQKPRVIHLATHGFFLEDTLTRRKRDKDLRFDKEPDLLTSSDPMQRSGLILAGGNHAWQGKTPIPNQADGLLTASEIGAMVLNNTELTVLSACETGLGDVKGSEGVFGLQRAFKMAGVKYLLMSLWQVDDEITNKFMKRFYGDWLINKTNVREAFQNTVKQFRDDYPNPYNWAAFVLLE